MTKFDQKYYESIQMLERYIEEYNIRPSKKRWNNYAVKNQYLSADSIEFIKGIKFNLLCRKMIIQIHKQKREKKTGIY